MARSSGWSVGRARGRSGSSARTAANSRMWSQPATAKQIAALKESGNFDGKYYSKGRAGQKIGDSIRGRSSSPSSRLRVRSFGDLAANLQAESSDLRATEQARAAQGIDVPDIAQAADQFTIHQEGIAMSNLVPAPNHNSSVVQLASSESAPARPFGYLDELEGMLLDAAIEHFGANDPRHVHEIEKGLARAKVVIATTLATAHNDLLVILRGAPSGVIGSPEAAAREALFGACSSAVEERLQKKRFAGWGRTHPSKVIDLLLAQVRHRVDMAKIYAEGQVKVALIQAAIPPAQSRGYEPCWGEVTGVKPYGAFIALPSGESGLLHCSEMQALNGARYVDDASGLVNVGQHLYVRVTGKTSQGKLNFALASEVDS